MGKVTQGFLQNFGVHAEDAGHLHRRTAVGGRPDRRRPARAARREPARRRRSEEGGLMIPLKYNIGNLKARRVSTLMTILGIGVVIAVMISMMALLQRRALSAVVSSGSKDNLMVMREGAEAELSSWVTKDAYRIIRALPGIAKDSDGAPLISPELVIIFKIPKKDDPKGSNVLVRGVTPMAFTMRPYVKIIDGRMFRPGVNEVIVARRIRDRFVNTAIGDTFQIRRADLQRGRRLRRAGHRIRLRDVVRRRLPRPGAQARRATRR